MCDDGIPEAAPFQYTPLPGPSHIRLLRRLPQADDGTLQFSLETHDIDGEDRNAFCCLSYTWGNPFAHGQDFRGHFDAVSPHYDENNKVRVLINGQYVKIQKNLHDALGIIPRSTFPEYVNNPVDGTHGQRWLHIAAAKGRPENVKSWLSRGADVNKVDDEDHNALHYAAAHGQTECVEILLRNGCRQDAKDVNGDTPFDLAKRAGHDSVVALLERSTPSELIDQHHQPRIDVSPTPGSELIWADAICINQNDVDEKSSQVSMMDRIYSAAYYVVAWLGPADDHSDAGVRALKTLRSHLKAFKESIIQPFSGKDEDNYAAASIPYISHEEWVSLASIYQRQWARRVWIVQEVVLPKAILVYLDKTAISWRDLGLVAEAIQHLEAKLGSRMSDRFTPSSDIGLPVISNMAELSQLRAAKRSASDGDDESLKVFSLRNLVHGFWPFMASDPRDKIFAYYGLLNVFSTERKAANYRMAPEAIYTITTRELISQEGNLNILSSCTFPLQRRDGLPSWVPDFSFPATNSIPRSFSADKGLEYTPPPTTTDPTDRGLQVKGILLGYVSKIGGRSGTGPEKIQFDRSWLTLLLSLREKNTTLGNKRNLSWFLWTTLCMNMSPGALFDPRIYEDKAPEENGLQFRYFMILLILSAADAKIREKLGLETTTKQGVVFSHLDYDPMVEDMEPVLADLDAIAEYDGADYCWLPSREEVLRYWNNFNCGLLRNTEAQSDDGPSDFYLPAGVTSENSRPIGNGCVILQCKMLRKCAGFITAYGLMYGGRQLITIEDALLGMASLAVRPGDEVWILAGLNGPAVLRPAKQLPNGDDEKKVPRYEFIGSSYVGGVMDGELDGKRERQLTDIELV